MERAVELLPALKAELKEAADGGKTLFPNTKNANLQHIIHRQNNY